MKIIRVKYQDKIFYAERQGDVVLCLDLSLGFKNPIPICEIEEAPLVMPSKVVCVGLNYKKHAAEVGMPLPKEPAFFLKPPSSIIFNKQTIYLPQNIGDIHYEAELALVLGKGFSKVSAEEVPALVLGYTCANDLTARDLQKTDILMGHCKGYDTFCPIGPCIETDPLPDNAMIYSYVNDELRQASPISDMIFSVYEIVSKLSHIMTFFPGDVILTGTPPNVGPLKHGDTVRVVVDHVGELVNFVENSN